MEKKRDFARVEGTFRIVPHALWRCAARGGERWRTEAGSTSLNRHRRRSPQLTPTPHNRPGGPLEPPVEEV